jgi:hypothetical protein
VNTRTDLVAFCKYSRPVFTSTIILSATVVIEGVTFRWWLTDGIAQQLTVSHPAHGTLTQPLTGDPESQAREAGRAMWARKVRADAGLS